LRPRSVSNNQIFESNTLTAFQVKPELHWLHWRSTHLLCLSLQSGCWLNDAIAPGLGAPDLRTAPLVASMSPLPTHSARAAGSMAPVAPLHIPLPGPSKRMQAQRYNCPSTRRARLSDSKARCLHGTAAQQSSTCREDDGSIGTQQIPFAWPLKADVDSVTRLPLDSARQT
jgi:hypothetical protein